MSLDLSYSAGLSPVFHFVPSGYVLGGTTTAELILRTRDGAELYRSSDGISVVDITLTKAMRFGDGTVLPSGSMVKALRVAPDLGAIDPPLADPADKVPMVYRYGLYVGRLSAGWDWDVQGLWTVNPDTGPVRGMCGPQAVCVGPVQVAVNVCGVQAESSAAADGYLELEFSAADLAGGLPLLIGSVPADTLICIGVIRFATYFDQNVTLKVGQEGNQKEVFGNDPPDEEGYETRFYSKFSGDILLYPEFATAPAIGAGVVYLTRG